MMCSSFWTALKICRVNLHCMKRKVGHPCFSAVYFLIVAYLQMIEPAVLPDFFAVQNPPNLGQFFWRQVFRQRLLYTLKLSSHDACDLDLRNAAAPNRTLVRSGYRTFLEHDLAMAENSSRRLLNAYSAISI